MTIKTETEFETAYFSSFSILHKLFYFAASTAAELKLIQIRMSSNVLSREFIHNHLNEQIECISIVFITLEIDSSLCK